jgi:hypothetical protein
MFGLDKTLPKGFVKPLPKRFETLLRIGLFGIRIIVNAFPAAIVHTLGSTS